MAISYPLLHPSSPGFRSISLRPSNAVQVATSPFTGQQQVQAHQGQFWQADVQLPPMRQGDGYADEWAAWLSGLRGSYGTFPLGDSSRKAPRGSASLGAGAYAHVNGASQSGMQIITKGWGNSSTVLAAGDYIEIGGVNLLRRSNDFSNSVWGKNTITVTPNNVTGPDGTVSADTCSASGSNSYINQSLSSVNPGYYTASIWLKVPSGTKITRLYLFATFVQITITESWQRFSVTTYIENFAQAVFITVGGGSTWSSGDIHFANAQCNQGLYPDAYQETSTTAINLTRRIHKITFAANSDSAGSSTLNIWPRLREPPANLSGIKTSNCVGTFRLASEPEWSVGPDKIYDIGFSAVEAI